MISLTDIKQDLPSWPDDVIDQWLLYLAKRPDTGWPPPDPLGSHPWTHILGDKPIAWWKNVAWQLQTVDCSFETLSVNTRSIVSKMYDAQMRGVRSSYSDENTTKRFKSALYNLLHNGVFPKPLIAMQIETGLSILDGNHRIAAHFASQKMPADQLQEKGLQQPSREQEVWIGRHSGGEVLES
jgi:hypothetical protein